MNKLKIARILAGISVVVGIVVMIGWYFDSQLVTGIAADWTRMKFSTALSFVFSGIIVYCLTLKEERGAEVRQIVLTVLPMFLVLIMGTLFLGSVFNFRTGLESVSYLSAHDLQTPIFAGKPSLASTINFLLVALIGFLFNFGTHTNRFLVSAGSAIAALGFLGLIGYAFNVPFLYYEIPGFSNAIAIHAAGLFILLGLAIFLTGRE